MDVFQPMSMDTAVMKSNRLQIRVHLSTDSTFILIVKHRACSSFVDIN